MAPAAINQNLMVALQYASSSPLKLGGGVSLRYKSSPIFSLASAIAASHCKPAKANPTTRRAYNKFKRYHVGRSDHDQCSDQDRGRNRQPAEQAITKTGCWRPQEIFQPVPPFHEPE